jgi:hypothetical protein
MKKAILCVMTVVAFLALTVLAMADQKSPPPKASSPPPQRSVQPAPAPAPQRNVQPAPAPAPQRSVQPAPAPAQQRSNQSVQPSTGTARGLATPTGQALKDLSSGAKTPGQTFDGSRGPTTAPAVNASTGTARTPQQAIDQYKASGPQNPGPQTLKIKEPPSPAPAK